MNNLVPIFSSHFSIGRSLLLADEPEEIKSNSPVSIFSIAKKHDLKEVCIADSSMSGFIQMFKSAEKSKINFRFGLKLVLCADLTQKDEASFETESKVIIWCLNSQGYKDLLKIYSKAATEGYYYIPRSSYEVLKSQMTENLQIAVPFYDSFLMNNNLRNHSIIPDFGKHRPVFCLEDHDLPFDGLLKEFVLNYAKNNDNEVINTHQVYYYKTEDSLAFLTYRCIDNRSTLNCPKIDHMASDQFSFESYLERSK